MKTFKKYLDKVFNWALVLAMVLLVAMVVVVFLNVVLRYGFNSGLRWAEEVPLIIVAWFTFIAMALGVKENLHININLLPKKLPKTVNDILNIIKYVLEIGIGVIFLYYGSLYTINGRLSILSATGLPNSVTYVVVPISAVFIILYAFYFLMVAIKDLKRMHADKESKHTMGGKQHV